MEKDKLDQERIKINNSIRLKETEVDNLKRDEKKMTESLSELQWELQKGFRELTMLNEEFARNGGSEGLKMYQNNQEQARMFQQSIRYSEEQLENQYKQQIQSIEKEQEDLYQKRTELSWD